MSIKGVLVILALVGSALATPLSAQTGVMSWNTRVLAIAKLEMNPAATALLHREALALTSEQVAALESLSAAMRPVIDRFESNTLAGTGVAVVTATGALLPAVASETVDRERIQAEHLQRAERMADIVTSVAEATRQVETILSVQQLARVRELQQVATTEIIRSMDIIFAH